VISLHEVQQDAVDILSRQSAFTTAPAVPVLLDDALQDEAVEDALNGVGACVLVSPVMTGTQTSTAGRLVVLRAELVVQVLVNPTRNADTGGAGRNMLELVEAVVSGLTASDPGPGEQRYTVPANFLNLDPQPDGVISYHVQIVKPCTIQ
jgi:hypothetical protein